MSELGFEGGEVVKVGRPQRAGRLRRPLTVLAVAVLLAAAYLAGIWTGTSTHITCTTTAPGQIVCGDTVDPSPAPAAPPAPQPTGSA